MNCLPRRNPRACYRLVCLSSVLLCDGPPQQRSQLSESVQLCFPSRILLVLAQDLNTNILVFVLLRMDDTACTLIRAANSRIPRDTSHAILVCKHEILWRIQRSNEAPEGAPRLGSHAVTLQNVGDSSLSDPLPTTDSHAQTFLTDCGKRQDSSMLSSRNRTVVTVHKFNTLEHHDSLRATELSAGSC